MKKRNKVLMISIPVAIFALLLAGVVWAVNTDTTDDTIAIAMAKPAPTVEALLADTNAEREKAGIPPVALHSGLNRSAQKKAEDMNATDKMQHVSPRDGRQGYEYAKDEMGATCSYVSENIHFSTMLTNEGVTYSWMNSESHRQNLLDPGHTYVGFGISGNYVAQHFCKAAK